MPTTFASIFVVAKKVNNGIPNKVFLVDALVSIDMLHPVERVHTNLSGHGVTQHQGLPAVFQILPEHLSVCWM